MTATLDLSQFEDTFVIHFGSDLPRVNAYTLATTLVGMADAAKAANAALNPGYEVEVVVEALSPGSFKATLRTIFNATGNLFSTQNVKNVVLGVIASYIYQQALGSDPQVIVNVGDHEVVIESGDTKVVVPRDLHEGVKKIEKSPGFRKGIGNAIRAVEADPHVTSFGIMPDDELPEPPVKIPRKQFAAIAQQVSEPETNERELEEITDVMILRAILERSKRLWQFAWNGVRISAPVTDGDFYNDFFEHRVQIAPGDGLRVRLRIRQVRNPDLGVFINKSYEVTQVMEHLPGAEQVQLRHVHDEQVGD